MIVGDLSLIKLAEKGKTRMDNRFFDGEKGVKHVEMPSRICTGQKDQHKPNSSLKSATIYGFGYKTTL